MVTISKKNTTSSLLLIAFFVVGFLLLHNTQGKVHQPIIKYVHIGDEYVKVELALTAGEHALGLSGRESMPPNTGMLFVFDRPGRYDFWMKDMNFPLDIIWIGADLNVVYIKKNALPDSYPEQFMPSRDVKYVLEVPAGFADTHKVEPDSTVEFVF